MTPRERKYHRIKRDRKRIHVRSWTIPAYKFDMEDLRGFFCMCIPNYCVDREGKIIPPADGSKPQDTFHFGKWVDGKILYDDKEHN